MMSFEDAEQVGLDRRATFTLGRILARRSVRVALAASGLRGGSAEARELLRAPMALDAPLATERRCHYPEYRVAHTGSGAISSASAPSEQLQPQSWRTRLNYLRPDLLLIDGPGPVTDGQLLGPVVLQAASHGVPIAAVGDGLELWRSAGITNTPVLELPWHGTPDGGGSAGELPLFVDPLTANPVGLPFAPVGVWSPGGPHESNDLGRARQSAVTLLPMSATSEVDHAQRVLELLASGVPVVCQPTPLLTELLGPHDDYLVGPDELEATAKGLANDAARQERASVSLRRHVLDRHGARSAFERVLEGVGLPTRTRPEVAVLLASRRPALLPATLAAIDRQTYPEVSVQLLLHGVPNEIPGRAIRNDRALTVLEVGSDRSLGQVLNIGLDATTAPLIAKMDDDDIYGPSHLADLVLAMEYSGAGAVGRWSNVVYLEASDRTVHQHPERQERWAHHLPGCTLLIRGDLLRRLRWRHVPRGVDTELVRAIYGAGERCYSTHRFGFIRRRHGDHTFSRGDRAFAREGAGEPGLDTSVLDV